MSVSQEVTSRIRQSLASQGIDYRDEKSVNYVINLVKERLSDDFTVQNLSFLKNMIYIAQNDEVPQREIAHTWFPNSDISKIIRTISEGKVDSETFTVKNNSPHGDFKITTPPEMSEYFKIEASILSMAKDLIENKPIDQKLYASKDVMMETAAKFCEQNNIPFKAERHGMGWDRVYGWEARPIAAVQQYGVVGENGNTDTTTFDTGFDKQGSGRLKITQMRLSNQMEKRKLSKEVNSQIKRYDPSNENAVNGLTNHSRVRCVISGYRDAVFQRVAGNEIEVLCQKLSQLSLNLEPVNVSLEANNLDYVNKLQSEISEEDTLGSKNKFDQNSPSI